MNSRSRAHSFKSKKSQRFSDDKNQNSKVQSLIFELGKNNKTGVDIDECDFGENILGDNLREEDIGLPGLSEPEVVRHFVNLSKKKLFYRRGYLSTRLLYNETQLKVK